jgi:hypothetical protein
MPQEFIRKHDLNLTHVVVAEYDSKKFYCTVCWSLRTFFWDTNDLEDYDLLRKLFLRVSYITIILVVRELALGVIRKQFYSNPAKYLLLDFIVIYYLVNRIIQY